ncbi:nuclease-related domain-containing protein [Tissierella praeacuta]|uniref:nuclease-related domain-containing protein n=1 Tax=Tissierella praeacuta TaxID=43131 RepID=UPI003DA5E7BB
MAKMFPPSTKNSKNKTNGEIECYDFFESILPDNYYVFWGIRVNNSYPDFIIVSPELGVLVLEVKDWSLTYIKSTNISMFKLSDNTNDTNPLEQAECYRQNAVEYALKKEHRLLQTKGLYVNKLKFPRACGVIFTNIERDEFLNSPHKNSIEQNFILFKDDLANIKDTGLLIEKLKNMFVPNRTFSFNPLSHDDMDLIKQVLYKESSIDYPDEVNLQKESISDKSDSHIKKSSTYEGDKPKPKKNFIQSLKNMIIRIVKVILIIFTFNFCIILLALIVGLHIRGDLRSIKDVPILVEEFIEAYNNAKESEFAEYNNTLKATLTFNVNVNPYGKGTFILIKDGNKYLVNKTFSEGSTIEFYDSKKIIIYESNSEEKEFNVENDVINLEIGNAYTKIYLEGEECKFMKYFKYDFVNREIISN